MSPAGSLQTDLRAVLVLDPQQGFRVAAGVVDRIVGDYVYRLHVPAILKCWHLADGRKVYVQRLDGISTTWASPIVDGNGRIYFANAGRSFAIRSGPVFHILATNDLGDGNHPSPVVAGGKMFLVGSKSVYCIGKK